MGERNEGGAVSDSSFGGDGLTDLSARNRDRRGGERERGREAPILGHHKGPFLKNVGIFDPLPPSLLYTFHGAACQQNQVSGTSPPSRPADVLYEWPLTVRGPEATRRSSARAGEENRATI